jgi:hypothetical protein
LSFFIALAKMVLKTANSRFTDAGFVGP